MIKSKQIVVIAEEIMNRLYMLLDENSTRLKVNAEIEKLAKDINVTNNEIRLSIHYLIMAGYLRTADGNSYDRNYGNEIEFTLSPIAIDKIEKNSLFNS